MGSEMCIRDRTDTLHNMPFEVTPKKVADAIKAADAYGHYFLGE